MIAKNDTVVTLNQQHAQNVTQTYLETNLTSIALPITHSIPRINDGITGYDGVGSILKHLFSNVPGWGFTGLNPPCEDPDNGWEKYGVLSNFTQAPFIETTKPDQWTGMQEYGWYFVPHNCLKEGA